MAKRSKELKIELTMDVSAAEKKSADFHAAERARIKADVLARADAENAKARSAEQAHKKIADSSQDATEVQKGHWGGLGDIQGMATEGLGKYAAGLAVVGTTAAVLNAVIEQWDKIKKDSIEAAVGVSSYRESLKELAALREGTGRTQGTLIEQAQFRAKTLMSGPGAEKLSREAWAAAELSVDNAAKGQKGTMSREAFQATMETAGKAQTMWGGDAGAWGELVGSIPLTSGGKRVTEEQGKAQVGKMFDLQQMGGFSSISSALSQYKKASPLAQSGIFSPEETMALLAGLSTSGGATSATALQQLTRMSSADFMRSRNMKVAEGVEFETSDKFMRQVGVKQNMTAFERIKTISRHVAEKMKNEPGFNAEDYLTTHGLTNAESRMGVIKMAGLMKGPEWKRIEDVMSGQSDPNRIDRQFDEAVKEEPTLQMAKAETAGALHDIERGLKTEGIRSLQKAAFEKRKAEEGFMSPTGTFEDWEKESQSFWNTMGPGKLFSGKVQSDVEQTLLRAGKKVGLPDPRGLTGTFLSGTGGAAMTSEQMTTFKKHIEEAGGDPTAEMEEDIRQTKRRLARLAPTGDIPPPMAAVPKAIEGRP